ncbi:MAG: hypothetical protein CVT66_07715 [Actinobacteria bacterium HGW-Actinobacteria-6]|nr:MAG: hypothetical protein CVT66_07715 [Actinobacteria bacterium HGW-Actinobacteria-6]
MSESDVYSLVKPKHAKGVDKMIGRWRQSFLVSLTAALFLGAAGAYAISLGSLSNPSRADLPVIALSGSIDPIPVASTTAPETATETAAEAPSSKPTVPAATAAPAKTSRPVAEKDAPREVVTPDVREDDPDDDEADEIHWQDDEESSDRESSSGDEPELDD